MTSGLLVIIKTITESLWSSQGHSHHRATTPTAFEGHPEQTPIVQIPWNGRGGSIGTFPSSGRPSGSSSLPKLLPTTSLHPSPIIPWWFPCSMHTKGRWTHSTILHCSLHTLNPKNPDFLGPPLAEHPPKPNEFAPKREGSYL